MSPVSLHAVPTGAGKAALDPNLQVTVVVTADQPW